LDGKTVSCFPRSTIITKLVDFGVRFPVVLDEWNVKFAEISVSEERRYSSKVMNCSCALLACSNYGRGGFNTVKSREIQV
jgi:hypothetical protein